MNHLQCTVQWRSVHAQRGGPSSLVTEHYLHLMALQVGFRGHLGAFASMNMINSISLLKGKAFMHFATYSLHTPVSARRAGVFRSLPGAVGGDVNVAEGL